MERRAAVDRILDVVSTIESDPLPVPVREIWVLGDVALGLDPVSRIDMYLRKDLLFAADSDAAGYDPERSEDFHAETGVRGVGKSVSARWAEQFPGHLRANDHGHAAPERCLAAHLVDSTEPIHLEVCNAGFEENVTQRLRVAVERQRYEQLLDPRGVCLWKEGTRSVAAPDKLREGEYVFPTLEEALEMLGMPSEEAAEASNVLSTWRDGSDGRTVRGDVV